MPKKFIFASIMIYIIMHSLYTNDRKFINKFYM